MNPISQAARQAIYTAATKANLPTPPQEAVDTVVDKLDPAKPLDPQKLLNMTAYESESLEGRTRGALSRTQFKDTALANKLATCHAFVAANNDKRIQQRLDNAKAAVQAAVSSSFAPASTVAAYWGYLNIRGENVKALTERMEDILQTGKSASLLPGNKVSPFHQEEVWPQMLKMLDTATENAKNGKPTQIDAQIFELSNPEFTSRLAQAAQAGNTVRANIDPGRLQPFMTKYEIDEIPVKLRALKQLAQAGVAISTYPIQKELGSTEDLMHRKVLRVGDEVLLSGMNANEGSGENIDGGYLVQGPGAHRLGQNLDRDIKASAGVGYADVYGEGRPGDKIKGKQPWLGARGLAALFDTLSGPSPAGSELPKAKNYAELQAQAAKAGLNIDDVIAVSPADADRFLAQGQALKLKDKAYELVEGVMRALAQCAEPGNVERLKEGTPPSEAPAGATVLGVADLPSEREALLLHGISQAEQFAYVPAYVITRPVAAALIARAEQLKSEGKELDIKVVMDSGVFPDGTSPNFLGCEMLENAGIPARWITLPRSGDHDRKLHAKLMLTDQAEYFGSTNFSKKGLKENWEESGLVKFDPADPASMELREKAKERFMRLWDHMSVEVDSREIAAAYASRSGAADQTNLAGALRESAMRDIITQVEKFEKESGQWMVQQARQPEVAAKVDELRLAGMDEGSAVLIAVEDHLGTDKFFESLSQLGSHQKLVNLAARAAK